MVFTMETISSDLQIFLPGRRAAKRHLLSFMALFFALFLLDWAVLNQGECWSQDTPVSGS